MHLRDPREERQWSSWYTHPSPEWGKSTPRFAVLQPPTNRVTKVHNEEEHIYVNLVALFVKDCDANDIKLKARFEDSPSTPYMIHPKNIRLYQEPNTQNPDQITVSGNSWESG